MGCKGYARTLREMKTYLSEALRWDRTCRAPTGQALSQARRKLTPARCREVVAQVQGMCTTARSVAALGYGGMRVLALDGTKLALPAYRALRAHFGCPTQSPMGPQASFTLLWDVGANQPVDWQVGPYRVCERVHAQDLIASLSAGDLLLADRNFASRRIMFALHQRHADWLMRVRCSGSGTLVEVETFVASGRIEQPIDLVLRDHHGKPARGAPTVPVRLVRMDLADGTTAVFITSLLDTNRHTAQALIDLYAARWRVETAFRELKIWHGLENFNARYPDGIAQEIAAVMLFQLLASELEAQARVQLNATLPPPPAPSQPAIVQRTQLRFNRRTIADSVVCILAAAARGVADLRQVFDESMFLIWRSRQLVGPRRSFPRERKSPARGWRDQSRKGKP
jgi:hypothetical protein